MITVVTCTYRKEPHFDWLADGLATSPSEFLAEWIVIDGYLWHDPEARARKLAEAVRGRFPYRHFAPKPTRWQGPSRYTTSDFWALANARNTALIVAKDGTRLAFTDDCAVLNPLWLARHVQWDAERLEWAPRGVGVAGTYDACYHAVVEDGILTGSTPFGDGDGRRVIMPEPGRAHLGWAYGLNMSIPLQAALTIGGWDEMYDGQAGSEDCDFAVRAERAGWPFMYDPLCVVHQVLDSHGVVCSEGEAPAPPPPRRPNKTAMLRADGIPHFCNEALVERLLWDDQTRVRPLATWFNPRWARATFARTGRTEQSNLGPTTYWLDNEPLAEMT